MTPEGRVKKKIKAALDVYKGRIYYYMPVPGGFGKPTVDYLGIFHGHGFAIEAKRARKEPTVLQEQTLADVRAAGGRAFVINDDASLAVFVEWLELMERLYGHP